MYPIRQAVWGITWSDSLPVLDPRKHHPDIDHIEDNDDDYGDGDAYENDNDDSGDKRLQVYFIKKQEKYAKANCMTTEAHFLETMMKI